MTDERLEQLLETALAPEISDAEIRMKRKARNGKMNKMMKTGLAFAACLAVLAVVGFGKGYFKEKDNSVSIEATEDKNTEKKDGRVNTVNLAEETSEEKPIKTFTLTAFSAKMDENVEVPLIMDNRQEWVIGGDEEKNTIHYAINTFFRCEGENIESIKYSVEGGFFEIEELPDKSIITDAKDYTGKLQVTDSCGLVDENGNNISTARFVTEYTLDYNAQQNDTTFFAVHGEKEGEQWWKDVLFYVDMDANEEAEKKAEIYTELLKDMEITCTVYYKDGTTASATIVGYGKAVTFEEAGIPLEENGEVLRRNGIPVAPNDKMAMIVFRLK